MGEGRGALRKVEAWRGAGRPIAGRGGEGGAVSYKVVVRPQALSWRAHLGQSVPSVKSRPVQVEGPRAGRLLSDQPPPPNTLSRSPQTHYTNQGPSPSRPQACPSGKLRDICCVTEAGLFPGQSMWGGSIGAGGGKAYRGDWTGQRAPD